MLPARDRAPPVVGSLFRVAEQVGTQVDKELHAPRALNWVRMRMRAEAHRALQTGFRIPLVCRCRSPSGRRRGGSNFLWSGPNSSAIKRRRPCRPSSSTEVGFRQPSGANARRDFAAEAFGASCSCWRMRRSRVGESRGEDIAERMRCRPR